MITGNLKKYQHFLKLNPNFEKAFAFLSKPGLKDLADGRHEIAGGSVYAMVQKGMGKGKKAAKLEAHEKYIDIQYVVAGSELIGVSRVLDCKKILTRYSKANDIKYFDDLPSRYLKLNPGDFVILFPGDAHAPLSGLYEHHKVVVKVVLG